MAINFSTSTGIFCWQPTAWLRAHGSDVASFLQGQFTQDLRGLEHQPAVYGLWLNVKGKVLGDSFVLRGGGADEFWIGSYHSPAAVIRERLETFVIADDVTIEDTTAGWAAVSVIGPEAGRLLAGPPAEGLVFGGRRTRGPNAEWVYPVAAAGNVRQRLIGTKELSAADLMHLRLDAGIPAVPAEIGPGDLPNEGGLEVDAISYAKGCYLGQEVMARLKSMGRVRRRLLRVGGAAQSLPALPGRLFAHGRQVGELRSAAGDGAGGVIGFAMLSLPNLSADTMLALAADGPPVLRLLDPP